MGKKRDFTERPKKGPGKAAKKQKGPEWSKSFSSESGKKVMFS